MDSIKSDLELIDNVKKNNDSNSFVELSQRHSPLCLSIYNKYSTSVSASGMSIEDLKDDKQMTIYKSILSYDPSKNVKFSTWLGNHVRYQCLNSISSDGKYITMEPEDLTRTVDKVYNQEVKNMDNIDYIFSFLKQFKDPRIQEVFKQRYFDGKVKVSWSKIANKMSVSTQTVINLHKRGMKILKQKLDDSSLFDKI